MVLTSMRWVSWGSVVVLVSGSASVPAQNTAAPRAVPAQAVIVEEEEVIPAAASQEPTPGDQADPATLEQQQEQEEQQKKQARLTKLKSLTFDRRPAAILAEWLKVEAEKHAVAGDDQSQQGDESSVEEVNGDAEEAKPDPFDGELQSFQRAVTLGDWPAVKEFLASLEEEEAKAAYSQLLASLRATPKGLPPGLPPGLPREYESQIAALLQSRNSQLDPRARNRQLVSFEDVFGLARAAPMPLDDEAVVNLGAILRVALEDGNTLESLVDDLKQELSREEQQLLSRRQAALLLMAAGEELAAGEFLPAIDEAREAQDQQGLNLLSRYYLALHQKEKKTEHLNQAWRVTQAVFTLGAVDDKERQEALKRAVDLAPKVREEMGQAWLDESFTAEPQRGMEIIAAIGSAAATGLQQRPTDPTFRLKAIELQTTAVNALLRASPERADQWREMLDLLASNWLREAAISLDYDESAGRGPQMQRDMYGNIFYLDSRYGSTSSSRRVAAIASSDLLENKPGEAWLQRVRPSMRPKFEMVFARLLLKVGEEDAAFPYIEKLAQSHPDKAEELVNSFLSVWTDNHDPNASRNRTSAYMFMYGYERRAESIPLTRSKQERNLRELAHWVTRLKALPIKKIDEKLLARAFTRCHSSAEVYRLEAIEAVFGDIEHLDPKTLAELAQQMRANLVGVWRLPATQENAKTKRKQKDIQAEVLRGYSVARRVVENGLEKHPDEWTLLLAQAALDHDENNYRRELARSSDYTARRQQAFATFQKAAKLYAETLPELSVDDITTQAFDLWFYASLGACDLQHVREDSVSDLVEPARIRDAILALPKPYAEKHLEMFANSLFTRMSAVNPAVKFRYLKHGFTIVGDHKQAAEARKVFDYYNDLVTEIRLRVALDGDDAVGQKPFGLFVNLEHTREIERESGGFGRYLQNQNTGRSYYYNYGRPTENYRDKFEEIVQQALGEQFEILSVTFQTDDVNSKALPEYGWRQTPYAYLLLQTRGPEVDKISPVRLDLDFLDTSGYVIIPVESQALPIDANPTQVAARPVENLTVTQTLDERQAIEGRLVLEIKATGQGLVPDLDQLLKLAPAQFDVAEIDDEGLSVSRFDPESDETTVISERSWLVSMKAKESLSEAPKTFEFAEVLLPVKEKIYQRYVDADLLAVDQVVSLEQPYGSASYAWIAWTGLIVLLVAAAGTAVVLVLWRGEQVVENRFQMPDQVTPFTVIGLLRHIESNNGLDESGRSELQGAIRQLEECYFASDQREEPDLEQLARRWIERSE